jgi:Na+/H+-dicarboxylate symporter
MKLSITIKIVIGFVLGTVLGQILYMVFPEMITEKIIDPVTNQEVIKNVSTYAERYGSYVNIISKIFLNLIKMIIGPLVFCTLTVGIAKLGDFKVVGRIGVKTLLYFYFATFMSLIIGLIIVNVTRPGEIQEWPIPSGVDASAGTGKIKTAADLILHIFPTSFFKALAENEILQIVIFSLFFGIALGSIGEAGKKLIKVFETLTEVVFKIVGYIMNLAPFAVFAAMTSIVSLKGLGILVSYVYLLVCFYGGLAFFVFVVLWGVCVFMKINYWKLLAEIKDALILSFSTASSEASMPQQFEALKRFGCPEKITGFVLPLGYSFNLDGSMMYMTFATGFIAQAYHKGLTLDQQILMLLTLMITSKGIAGVPRASLVVIAGTLAQFNLPAEGLVLILGIDPFLDMGRSATSVAGNAVATCVISRLEGELAPA